jgi:hypothetical protein
MKPPGEEWIGYMMRCADGSLYTRPADCVCRSLAVLAVIFYVVLTPVALVFRLIGRDALARRLDADNESYWEERPPASEPARYLRQF